jgi:hypothetical protein
MAQLSRSTTGLIGLVNNALTCCSYRPKYSIKSEDFVPLVSLSPFADITIASSIVYTKIRALDAPWASRKGPAQAPHTQSTAKGID